MIVWWLPRAIDQLLLIVNYIREDNPGAAVELHRRSMSASIRLRLIRTAT